MRWKRKTTPIPQPEDGDTKIVKRFAFVPMLMESDEYVWLESYYAVRELQTYYTPPGVFYQQLWVTIACFPDLQSVVNSEYY